MNYVTIPESRWNRMVKTLERVEKYFADNGAADQWLTAKQMMKLKGFNKEQLRGLRVNYPSIIRYKRKDDRGRMIGIEYNLTAYNKIFTTPIN